MAEKVLALLRVRSEDGPEQVIRITKATFNIGRITGNDLQLSGGLVSRRHARLLIQGDRLSLIDLKSSNGIQVEGSRIPANQPYPLEYGQIFKIGGYELRVEAIPAPSFTSKPDESYPAPDGEEAAEARRAAFSSTQRIKLDPAKMPARPAAKEPPAPPVRRAAPPPPPPIPPPAPPGGPFPNDDLFGIPGDQSRYLQYLPPIYSEHFFLGNFLLAFEGILTPIEQIVDNFDLYLDPQTTPAFFLGQLARWLALTVDEKWPAEKQRSVLAEAADLYRRRGTRWSLTRYLEIYTEVTPEIIEPDNRPHFFKVILRVSPKKAVDQATVKRIIEASKPAHTYYELEIIQSQ